MAKNWALIGRLCDEIENNPSLRLMNAALVDRDDEYARILFFFPFTDAMAEVYILCNAIGESIGFNLTMFQAGVLIRTHASTISRNNERQYFA